MAKVYIITSGSYSDYRIDCIFSTKEKANKFMVDNDYAGKHHSYSVEGWEMDDCEGCVRKDVWVCYIHVETGSITHERTYKELCSPHHTLTEQRGNEIKVESSVSQNHARKLAAEKRQEVLRLNALKVEPGRIMKGKS